MKVLDLETKWPKRYSSFKAIKHRQGHISRSIKRMWRKQVVVFLLLLLLLLVQKHLFYFITVTIVGQTSYGFFRHTQTISIAEDCRGWWRGNETAAGKHVILMTIRDNLLSGQQQIQQCILHSMQYFCQ